MSNAATPPGRRLLGTVLKVGVSVGLVVFLLRKAGLHSLAAAFQHADWRWVALALAAGFAATLAQTTQWRFLLRAHGLHRSWQRCLRLVYVGNAFNTVLPSAIGGDVVRAAMVADAPEERVQAAATVVLQRLCNFPGMVALMVVGLLATIGDGQADGARLIAAAAILGGVVGLGLCMTPLFARLSRTRLFKALKLAKLFGVMDEFRNNRREVLAASARGTVFWSLSVVNQYAFMHALGIPVHLGYAAIVVTLVNALTMLPISVNGYGVRDGAFVGLLTANAITSPAAALAASFCLAAQSLLWAAIGIVCWMAGPRTRLDRAPDRAGQPGLQTEAA